MKWRLIGFGSLGVLAIAGVSAALLLGAPRHAAGGPPRTGALGEFKPEDPALPVPEVAFQDAGGATVSLAQFKGKLVLLNVWATWCAPCVHEMPSLDRLQQQRGGDRFAVVTVSEDRNGEKAVGDFFDKNAISSLPRYVDPGADISRALNLHGLPTTLLIGSDGKEIGRYEGIADWSGPEAQQLIDWYLQHEAAG
jgi:thiol-disulfide isomerase/thioredoxin